MSGSTPEDAQASGSWVVLAASEIGTSHVRKDLPCQDASRVQIQLQGLVVGAVADGIGSAAHSDAGAKTAVDSAVDFLAARAAELLTAGDEQLEDCCRQATVLAAKAVKDLATEQAHAGDDYACTLILLLVAPDWIAALSVGDGFAVWRPVDSPEHQILLPPEKGDFVNYTSAITSTDLQEVMRFEVRRRSPGFALASSDGLLFLALKSQTWQPHLPFFKFIEEFTRDESASQDKLRKLLAAPQINELTDDDKTLLLVCGKRPAPAVAPPRRPPFSELPIRSKPHAPPVPDGD